MTISITKTTKYPGEYTYELSNGHTLRISYEECLREWHLFAYDKYDNSYEPCHPFHDSFRDAKSYIPEALKSMSDLLEDLGYSATTSFAPII